MVRLSLRDVRCQRGGRVILEAISLDAAAGECVGILGPNGAGKTTLLRIITGMVSASGGTVRLENRDVQSWPLRERAQALAYLPQGGGGTAAVPFRAREIVLMGRTPYLKRWQKERAEDFAAVERAMALTDTARIAERDVTTLSGGEMQRVALARALAQEPRVLLLDEPTASLDLRHQVEILGVVRHLAETGVTVVIALHDLNLAASYCSTVVLLRNGEVYRAGPPQAVLTPETVGAVFEVEALLVTHPVTGLPYVLPTGRSTAAPPARG